MHLQYLLYDPKCPKIDLWPFLVFTFFAVLSLAEIIFAKFYLALFYKKALSPSKLLISSRRMVASILFDIQQYQNQPYNLLLVSEIRDFLINLQPFRGYDTEKQFNEYIWKCSLEVEPRNIEKPPRFVSFSA